MRIATAVILVLVSAVQSAAWIPRTAAAQEPEPVCGVRGGQRWLSTRPSPLDSATVRLGERIAKVCYSRPAARGRDLDSLVPLRRAWRTGANEPTTLTITGSLDVGGAVLDPGRYVILAVPDTAHWTLVFHTTPETDPAKMFQTLKQVADGRGKVERLAEAVEQFTIRSESEGLETALILEWGLRRVRFPVRPVP